MGKAGRIACIFTPFALTIASLICLILVFSGQTNKDMQVPRDLWFFKANTKDFNHNPDLTPGQLQNLNIDNRLLQALQQSAKTKELKDFYKVGLWNYCEGDIDDKGKETITFCSDRKANFWFNPFEVWQLQDTIAQEALGDKLNNGIDIYHKVAKWMFVAYVIAISLTAAEILVGIAAIFSRWGSFITTIISTAQTVFFLAAAATSTAVYATLVGVFESVLKPYNVKSELGGRMLATVWLGVAFSIASGFFWLISVCCCSGKSPHSHKKTIVEKTPYTYERVASPYGGAAAHDGHMPAHGTTGSAYEPYRQQHV